jgi:hypothetical protein
LHTVCAGFTHVQVPARQAAPAGQTLPHAPQLALSVCSFTHALPHWVRLAPGVQNGAHAPCEQRAPPAAVAPQTFPQAPQLVGLEARSAHWPLQSVGRAPAVHPHAPFTHCCPPVHARPQAPQLPALVVVSTQAPLQLVVPGAHIVAQTPPEQTLLVPVQAVPQAPQLVGLDRRSTQVVPHKVCPTTGQIGPASAASRVPTDTSPVAVASGPPPVPTLASGAGTIAPSGNNT